MRCSSALYTCCFLGAAWTAHAECMVCDEVIEINSARATCFMENQESIAKAVSAAPDGRMSVDFDACTVGGEKLTVRGGVATLPELNGSANAENILSKSVYLLDSASVACLTELIREHQGPLDPVATFDLFEQCKP